MGWAISAGLYQDAGNASPICKPRFGSSAAQEEECSRLSSLLRTVDLRRKILFTLGIVILYRVGATVPSPGVNYPNVQECLAEVSGGDSRSSTR